MRSTPALFRRLGRYYAFYAAGFVCLVIFLAVAEQFGLSPALDRPDIPVPPPSPSMLRLA
jgi:hypothetical protein